MDSGNTGENPTPGALGVVPMGSVPNANGVRGALLALTRQLDRGLPLAEAELTANIRFATALRDDLSCGARERLRAVEFLEAVRARGIDVAMYLDKAERPSAAPGAQFNFPNAEGIVFNIVPLPPKGD